MLLGDTLWFPSAVGQHWVSRCVNEEGNFVNEVAQAFGDFFKFAQMGILHGFIGLGHFDQFNLLVQFLFKFPFKGINRRL